MLNFLKDRLADLKAGAAKFARDRDFAEGTMAVCAMVANADGQVEPEERRKIGQFIRASDYFQGFDHTELVNLFERYSGFYEWDAEIGHDRCLKEIGQVRGDEKRLLIVRVGMAIARADGELEPAERDAMQRVCRVLGLDPTEFGLR